MSENIHYECGHCFYCDNKLEWCDYYELPLIEVKGIVCCEGYDPRSTNE
jgi:hypothetical protein